MSLKVRVDHLLIGIFTVVVLIAGLWAWRAMDPEPERAELDDGLESLRDNERVPEDRRVAPRFVRRGGAFSSSNHASNEGGEGLAIPQAPQQLDPGDLGPDEAVDQFKSVLAELESAVDDDRRLDEREQAEFYNRATGSFTALSAWADGSNPTERALMEDAYAQMKSLMRELDIQPPTIDPSPPPARR